MSGVDGPPALGDYHERLRAQRLLAAIYPTRRERMLSYVKAGLWRINEEGLPGWLGDRIDDYVLGLRNKRAERNLDWLLQNPSK